MLFMLMFDMRCYSPDAALFRYFAMLMLLPCHARYAYFQLPPLPRHSLIRCGCAALSATRRCCDAAIMRAVARSPRSAATQLYAVDAAVAAALRFAIYARHIRRAYAAMIFAEVFHRHYRLRLDFPPFVAAFVIHAPRFLCTGKDMLEARMLLFLLFFFVFAMPIMLLLTIFQAPLILIYLFRCFRLRCFASAASLIISSIMMSIVSMPIFLLLLFSSPCFILIEAAANAMLHNVTHVTSQMMRFHFLADISIRFDISMFYLLHAFMIVALRCDFSSSSLLRFSSLRHATRRCCFAALLLMRVLRACYASDMRDARHAYHCLALFITLR